MSEFKRGDTVRAKDPDGFISDVRDKVRDRDATVLDVLPALGGGHRLSLLFHKRNGRGKEFKTVLNAHDFVRVTPA